MQFTIEIDNFQKIYKDTRITFKHLVIKQKVTLLVGQNGCGKSTLIKAICGLIHYQGQILSKTVSFAYMSEQAAFPADISVMQFLASLNELASEQTKEEVIVFLLTKFELDHKAETPISKLSKGMKTKVNLIQCLMSTADVYILDEPLSGLDENGVTSLLSYIKDSPKQFVISTHLSDGFKSLKAEVLYL